MKPKSDDRSFDEFVPILRKDDSDCSSGIPARYVLAILGCLGFFNVYTMRVNLSVALVAMVNSSRPDASHYAADDDSVVCHELLHDISNNNSSVGGSPVSRGEFDWDSKTQALVLGSFFYGYVVTQIPGGILAERYGAKRLMGFGVLVTAIFTLLTPIAARWSVWALVIVRAIEGLGEGVTYPAINVLIGRWVPKMERSRLATLIFIGSPIGTVVSLAISGVLCDSDFMGGWPSVFYIFGFLGCIWFALWWYFVYESPHDHPSISKAELRYICWDQGEAQMMNTYTPWKSILTSVPVWALIVTHCGQNWGFYTLLTEMPTFLANILHFDIKKNGFVSALPYLMLAVTAYMASIIADKVRSTRRLKITTIRKINNSIAFFGPGLCLLGIVFLDCSPVPIVILLTVALGLNGLTFSGFNVTHVDMSPEFAGTLMGITNCIANFAGFLAPAYVGRIIDSGQSLHNWDIIFITTSAVYFFAGSVYNIFGSAEYQNWTNQATDTENPIQRRLS